MKYDFINKEAVFREGSKIFLVLVTDVIENDWGVRIVMEILENKIGKTDGCDIEYSPWTEECTKFGIEGQWSVTSFHNDIFTLMYVTCKLNFRQQSIDAFRREEEDFFELWMPK